MLRYGRARELFDQRLDQMKGHSLRVRYTIFDKVLEAGGGYDGLFQDFMLQNNSKLHEFTFNRRFNHFMQDRYKMLFAARNRASMLTAMVYALDQWVERGVHHDLLVGSKRLEAIIKREADSKEALLYDFAITHAEMLSHATVHERVGKYMEQFSL